MNQLNKSQHKDQKGKLKSYVRFTGIAFQMGVTIYLGFLLGEWLDKEFLNKNQFYTKVCTLAAVFATMFSIIIQVIKLSKE